MTRILFLLAFCVCLISCSSDDTESTSNVKDIVGTWEFEYALPESVNVSPKDIKNTISEDIAKTNFNQILKFEDDVFTIDDLDGNVVIGKYYFDGENLITTINNIETKHIYKLNGSKLSLLIDSTNYYKNKFASNGNVQISEVLEIHNYRKIG